MVKINSLYIFIIVVFLLIVSVFSLNYVSDSLELAKQQNKQYMMISNKYNNLKEDWKENSKNKNKIEKILKLSNINNANVTRKDKTIVLRINNVNMTTIDKFMNKILNEKIIIKKFSLEKSILNLEVEK